MSLLSALTTAILPVLSVAGVGFLLGRYREVDVDPLAVVTLYVLMPALVFHSLVTTPISGATAATLFAGVGAFTAVMVVASEAVGRLVGEQSPTLGSLVLSSTFPNAGNYGIPLSAFAFGAIGRSTAVLYIAAQSVLMYTLGVYVASRGASTSARDAVLTVFRLPLVYAVVLAGIAQLLGVVPPADSTVMQTLKLTGDSSIPVMLLLLGIQLANTTYGTAVIRTAPAVALKLFVAPVAALGVALAVGLDGPVGRVFVLECAMPAAVTPLMLTVEFGEGGGEVSAAEYVSTAIMVSTLASVVTLTALIAVLRSGTFL
ncbi:AEC family transporter [Halostella sp. JP-L12]|uniref:AEC family transporter n=1 Tax=Halostella TaxID=1843185 RepID=UPI000EF80DD7|nr:MULTISPECIES: AEC family transporter [Halostella]NHN48911.1 AEC family transporter [Halostella sp. JP-L12]